MKITKYGHCCLLIEVAGKRVLTDPGRFSNGHTELTDIDLILITHEHGDHCHTDSVIHILDKNPQAVVVTNTSVEKLLAEQGIVADILEGQASGTPAGIPLQAFDGKHVEIVGNFGLVQNTGYLVADRFFYPGDAYTLPNKPVEVLALPVAGPWCKLSEAIAYGLAVGPKIAIPVHDAVLSEFGTAVTYPHCKRELEANHITFMPLAHGIPTDLTV